MNMIIIRGLSLPGRVRGCTVPLPETDDFIVFINTNLSPERQQKTVRHELRHIKLNHFWNGDPVIINEMEAG